VKIETIDNPGWSMEINFAQTPLRYVPFSLVNIDNGDDDWYVCTDESCYIQSLSPFKEIIIPDVFAAHGDPYKLIIMLNTFQSWVNSNLPEYRLEQQNDGDQPTNQSEILAWLMCWYASNCDGDWEHCYGISIKLVPPSIWEIQINIEETNLEDKPFTTIDTKNSDKDWIYCFVEQTNLFYSPTEIINQKFHGSGDLTKLEMILNIFRNWAQKPFK
jgi:hypothetical protein